VGSQPGRAVPEMSSVWNGGCSPRAQRPRAARGALPRRPAPPSHRSHRLHEGQQGGRPPVLVARWHLIPTTSPTTSSEDWSVRRSPEAHVRRLASQVEALGLNLSTTPARPQLEPSPLDLGASPRDAGAPRSAATTALSSAPSVGRTLARRRLGEGVAGVGALHALIAEHAISPLVAARCRERHAVSGARSDAGDAHM